MFIKDSEFIPIEQEKLTEPQPNEDPEAPPPIDSSEIVTLMEKLNSELQFYLSNLTKSPIQRVTTVLEEIFQKIQCFRFPLIEIAQDYEFFNNLHTIFISSPHIELLHAALACFGVSIEKYPEIKKLSIFSALFFQVYVILDEHMNITVSPIAKILILTIDNFDRDCLKKLKDIIKNIDNYDHLNQLSQVIQHLSKFVFLEENISEKSVNLKKLMKVIDILIADKGILDPNIKILIKLLESTQTLENKNHGPFADMICNSKGVIMIFQHIHNIEQEYLYDSLNLIYLSLKYNQMVTCLLTFIRTKIDFYFHLADNPSSEEFFAVVLQILCQSYRLYCKQVDSPERHIITKIFELLQNASFDIKLEAMMAFEEISNVINQEEAEFLVENNILDYLQDSFETDEISKKKMVLSTIRHLAEKHSVMIAEALMNISDFFEEIEETIDAPGFDELKSISYVIHCDVQAMLDPDF